MPDFPVISPGLITCCRPRLSLTSLPRPCPGYYRSLLSLTTSLITCCRPRLSLTSLPRLCPGYYRSLLSLTTSSPISSWLLTCSAPWLHSSSRLPVLHLGPHHTRDNLSLLEGSFGHYHLQFSSKHNLHNLVRIQLRTGVLSSDTPVETLQCHRQATRESGES